MGVGSIQESLSLDAHLLQSLLQRLRAGDGEVRLGQPAQPLGPVVLCGRSPVRLDVALLGDLEGGESLGQKGVEVAERGDADVLDDGPPELQVHGHQLEHRETAVERLAPQLVRRGQSRLTRLRRMEPQRVGVVGGEVAGARLLALPVRRHLLLHPQPPVGDGARAASRSP